MSEDKDRIWTEALAGRDDGDSTEAREGRALRLAILARAAESAPPQITEDPHRVAALLARARREGLIPAAASRWLGWRGGLAAALVVGAVGLAVYWRAPVEPETVRGVVDGVTRIEAADPLAFQTALMRELRDAGVQATGYERLGRFGIDADLPQPVPDPVLRILKRRGLPIPGDGVLRVEIRSRAKE
jgi:hypothetical protein